mgnify:CR=1 FL=1
MAYPHKNITNAYPCWLTDKELLQLLYHCSVVARNSRGPNLSFFEIRPFQNKFWIYGALKHIWRRVWLLCFLMMPLFQWLNIIFYITIRGDTIKIFYEGMIIYFVKYLVEHVLVGIQDNYRSSQSRIDWCTLIHCIISSIYRQESIVLSSFVVIVVKDKSR